MRIFYKVADILLKLREMKVANVSEIMRETDMTYAYIFKCIKSFENKGCIVKENSDDGREKLYKLTEKGKRIADAIDTIEEIWKR